MKLPDGNYRGILWNLDDHYKGQTLDFELNIPALGGEYCMLTKTVDEECCNPLKLWHDIGEPSSLSTAQKELLIEHAKPLVRSENITLKDSNIEYRLILKPNAVVYFEFTKVERKGDRGFSYERIINGER